MRPTTPARRPMDPAGSPHNSPHASPAEKRAIEDGAEGRTMSQTLRVTVVIALYLLLNSSLNMLNKWALASFFPFPLLLTTVHMMFSFVMLLPVMMLDRFRSLHLPALRRQWFGLVCIGLFMAINIGLNNLSLVLISLSLNQVIRSGIPVATAVLAVAVENRVPTRAEFTSLLVLTAGVMIAVWEGAKGSLRGICFASLGMLSNAAMMTTSGRVLSEKMDVFRLSFYTAPVSCVALLPFVYLREVISKGYFASQSTLCLPQSAKFQTFMALDYRAGAAIMLVTSANALAYNVIHNAMIKMTSAVTTTVIGEAKIVGLFILSALLLGESKEFTVKMSVGVVTAMAGFFMYSHCKLAAAAAKRAEEAKGLSPPHRSQDAGLQNGADDPEKQPLWNGQRK